MNHRHLLWMSILLAAPMNADEVIHHKPGEYFTQTEIKEILQRLDSEEDLLVFKDGTPLKGKVVELPKVNFSFGQFPLNVQDIAAIAFSDVNGKTKIQMVTHEGYSFVAGTSENSLPFIQYFPSIKDPKRTHHHSIELGSVSYILLNRDSYAPEPKPSRLHLLELSNGDRFPVLIAEEEISLSNGWEKFSLRPDALLDVNFDGGLYGTVMNRTGGEKELGFSFVTDSHLRVKIYKSPQTVGIPWGEVYAIQKQESPAYEVAEFVVSSEQDQIEDVKKEPLPVMRQKDSDQLPETIVWVEDLEPKVRFHPDSAIVDQETIAWVEDPEPRFHDDEFEDAIGPIAWVGEDIGPFGHEERQVAMLQEEKTRLLKDWNDTRDSLEGRLTAATEDSVKLQSRLAELEEGNQELEARNDELQESLHSLKEKWIVAVSELKDEKALVSELQRKLGYLTSSIEVEMEAREKLEGPFQRAKDDAVALEQQVEELNRELILREETVAQLKNELERKYLQIADVFKEQKEVHQELLQRISQLEDERVLSLEDKQELAALNRVLEELTLTLHDTEGKKETLQEQYDELKSAILSKTSVNSEALQDNDQLHAEVVTLVGRMVTDQFMDARVKELKQQIAASQDLVADLQVQLAEMSDKIGRSIDRDEAAKRLSERVEEVAELKRAYMENEKDLYAQIDHLVQSLVEAKGNVDQLGGALSLAEKEAAEKEAVIEQLKESLQKANVQLAEMENMLEQKDDELRSKDEKIAALVSQLDSFIAKHEVLEQGRIELGALVQALREKISEKEERIVALDTALDQREAEWARRDLEHEDQIARLNEKLLRSREEIDEKDIQIDRLAKAQENSYELGQQLIELQNERAQLLAKFEEVSQTVAGAESEQKRLRDDYVALVRKNGELTEELSRVETVKGSTAVEVNELREQIVKEKKKSDDFKKKMDQLFPQYDKEKEKGQQLQDQVARMSTRMHDMENALKVAEAREVNTQDKYSRLIEENRQLSKENQVLLQQLRQEQSRLQEQRELASRLNKSLHSQKSNMERMEKSQIELVSELENARTANTHLIKQYHHPESTKQYHQPENSREQGEPRPSGSSFISFKGIHIVASGENLNNISMKYYNTPHRWADIYEANQDVISDVNRLQVGTPLVIPD